MSETSKPQSPEVKRWYDHDPYLIEVLNILQSFQEDVRHQAERFLQQIEEAIGKEALDEFYAVSRPTHYGNRWYDKDPVISKAVELLRVIPPDAQRKAATRFLDSMKKQGITPESLNSES